MLDLNANGTTHKLDIDPSMPLLWALRDHRKLTGTKYGYGISQCASCTVLLDQMPQVEVYIVPSAEPYWGR
jgi:aerobic-type carbon monoxide dehydrogenase small subunit (CoxS/CutS family)